MTVVVVHDPTRALQVGTIVDGDLTIAQAHRRTVALPVDPEQALSALSGYAQRYWGDGWAPVNGRLERACPIALAVDPGSSWVYWTAMIAREQGKIASGQVRLVTLPGAAYLSAGMSQDCAPPAFAETQDLFAIRGRNRVQVQQTGVMQLALHGGLSCARVLLTAVTRCQDRVDFDPIVHLGQR